MNSRRTKQGYKITVYFLLLLLAYILIDPLSAYQNYIIFKVPTESMLPTIKPVSVVVVNKGTKCAVGDIVAYKNVENKVVVHRIVSIENGMVTTKGDNNKDKDKMFYKSLIIGKVIHIYSMTRVIIFSCVSCVSLFLIVYVSSILFRKKGENDEAATDKNTQNLS